MVATLYRPLSRHDAAGWEETAERTVRWVIWVSLIEKSAGAGRTFMSLPQKTLLIIKRLQGYSAYIGFRIPREGLHALPKTMFDIFFSVPATPANDRQ